MHWAFEHNPATLKRWRRFRQMRRAWWSLWILIALYTLSLGSELICSNTPLFVRFEGRFYFPVLTYHPEDTFLHNGRDTRADYKLIAQSPSFQADRRNLMVFPLVPYGPLETTDPDSIRLREAVTLEFTPNPHIATLTLGRDLSVKRATGADFFFPGISSDFTGLAFTNFWIISEPVHHALELRWRNEPAPPIQRRITSRSSATLEAELSLSEFTPRTEPPTSLRLLLRECPEASTVKRGSVNLDKTLRVVASTFPPWDTLSGESRSTLTALASARLKGACEDQSLIINGTPYTIRATPVEVRWPFRPTAGHWLGIDSAGRDVLARLLYGLRTSMTFGFLLVAVTMMLGILLGAVQGYFGKAVDIVGQRFTEIWSAIPFLYVMILLGAVYGRGFVMLLFCYSIFNWIGISYYVRSEFLRLRHLPFVESARVLGLPHRTIIFRHILPNALVPLITFFPFYLVGTIGSLAALDYLGFGLPPPTASWGELLAQAQQFRWAWWLILYPSLALFCVMLLGVFVGEGIRNAYDPRPATKFE